MPEGHGRRVGDVEGEANEGLRMLQNMGDRDSRGEPDRGDGNGGAKRAICVRSILDRLRLRSAAGKVDPHTHIRHYS